MEEEASGFPPSSWDSQPPKVVGLDVEWKAVFKPGQTSRASILQVQQEQAKEGGCGVLRCEREEGEGTCWGEETGEDRTGGREAGRRCVGRESVAGSKKLIWKETV
eukprot:587452-Hanusia_phi.AAC.3